MAAKRLGLDREAEELWQAAKAQLPNVAEGPKAKAGHLPHLQIFELLLDEAEPRFTKLGGPPPAASAPSTTNPPSRN